MTTGTTVGADAPERRDHPEPPLAREYDVVVVGGGMAGLELAGRMEGSRTRVAVLEGGPQATTMHNNLVMEPQDALATWLEPGRDLHFARPWRARRPPHFETGSGIRTRVGGRSLYWYGVVLPVDEWALSDPAWDARLVEDLCGTHGWYAETRKHLDRWRGAPVATGHTSWAGLDLHPTPKAVRPAPARPGRWFAYSPLDYWRDPVTGTPMSDAHDVEIHANTSVSSVLVEDGRAVGVLCNNPASADTVEVRAPVVVLAAGTIPSGTLALQALADVGSRRPRLGRLTDHIVQGFFLRLRAAAADAVLAELPAGSTFARLPELRSNLFLEVARVGPNEVLVDVRVTGEQLPHDRNGVSLDPTDAHRRTWVDCQPGAADRSVIRAQREWLQVASDAIAVVAGHPATRLEYGDYDRPARGNDTVLPDRLAHAVHGVPSTWSSFLGTEDHEGGILPLGDVLDEHHEFVDVPGLFAAGPCAFPRMGAANPTLTTLALSRRLGDTLVGRLHQ